MDASRHDGGQTISHEAVLSCEREGSEEVKTERGRVNEPAREMWWTVQFDLPPCRAGVRYGTLIEEFELMPADPEDPSHYVCETTPHGMALRGPLFSHVVYIGE